LSLDCQIFDMNKIRSHAFVTILLGLRTNKRKTNLLSVEPDLKLQAII